MKAKSSNEFYDTPLRIPPFEWSTLETNAELRSSRELQEFPRSRGCRGAMGLRTATDSLVGLARVFCFWRIVSQSGENECFLSFLVAKFGKTN